MSAGLCNIWHCFSRFFPEALCLTMESWPRLPARTVLFQKEASGVTYRIPALVFLPWSSCFLAFCEERLSPADSHAHLLVLRKGTFYKNYVEWEDMRVLSTASLPGYRSMNPCPVYDAFTGTLFLFFIAVLGHTSEAHQLATGNNVTKLCCVSSNDHGETWSPVTDLTHKAIGDTIKGHGIQLKSGRLLVPAYAYHIDCRNCFGKLCKTTAHSFCFRSDTHGRDWHLGRAVPSPECVECQLVSVDEEERASVLYCNARSALGYRVQALSFDGGATFEAGQLVPKLAETRYGCHGSMVSFPAPLPLPRSAPPHPRWETATVHTPPAASAASKTDLPTPTWVVYGHPTWQDARRDLGLHLSVRPRDPDSWTKPWVIYEGPSAYSDLACVEVQTAGAPPITAFACLFENGRKTAYEEISFCMFTLYDVMNNVRHSKGQSEGSLGAEKQKQRKKRRRFEFCRVC
ncbi:sialidase-4 isoform X2 [Electrophorus electricus]|uniref:sialidase-4 isoform X2 n=1 Tax=Electrophorus electricus TaxID=8005 RepID=UPI0015D00A20|nr:sialidase-4 isoform X2 [Electrophorus electricus]